MVGAEQIKKLRSITGLNQTDFAIKIGTTQNRVSMYENGRTRILLDSFLDWCKICEIDFEIKEKE